MSTTGTIGGMSSVRDARYVAAALKPYVPRLVRAWSEEAPAGPRARVLDGSLVSVDISGFTALAERLAVNGKAGAEELVGRISSVFAELIGVAERHGGDVLKFRGDALLLFFPGERHAERASGAASDMQWTIEEIGTAESSVGPVSLGMSAGVHSGECHFFLTQVPHHELVICGPAATRVFELENLASSGEIVVSAETAEHVDPGWLGDQRDGARLMQRLEPGVSAVPPPPDVDGRELDLYVPAPLRDHLAVASGEAEHRRVTVAFLKLSGTDDLLATSGVDAVLERLDALAAVADTACAAYGITWLESDIDVNACKLYLTAGAPSTTGDDAEGMLRGLREILAEDVGLPVRAGVNRGAVFTGDIGAASRRTYAVMGDAVNLAARLTGRAGPGELLATADVLDRTRTAYASDREPVLVKGKERAVMAHHVGEALGPRESAQVDTIPVIGREAELELLREALTAARRRELRAVELVAPPGMGKSRLVRELRTLAVGFQVLSAAADPYATTVPYSIWPDLLRPLAGITPDQTREEAGELLALWIHSVMPDLVSWLPLLAIPFGASVASTPEVDALDPVHSRDRLHATVESFLERVLLMPTLILVEDLHWLDDGSRLLLHHLVRAEAARPWVICATTRPAAETIIVPGGPGRRIVLEPLSDESAESFALAVAQEHALSTEAIESLAARAGGNPFFLRELVFAARHGAPEELPESVETLLTTRIDTMAPIDRMLLRYASVVGPAFRLELLGAILGDEVDGAGDPSRWDTLGEFVVPLEEGVLAFRHDLVRATAYEGLSFRRRREIHERVGLALEERAGDRVDEEAARLSLHFAEAGDHARAWRYATAAGRQAEASLANVDAAALFDRALAAADALGSVPAEEVVEVSERLGDVCERFAAYDRAAAAYARVLELAPDDAETETRLVGKRGSLRERVGEYDEAMAVYREGLTRLDSLPGTVELLRNRAEIELGAAGVRYRQGRFEDALEFAELAGTRAEAADDRRRLAHAFRLMAVSYNELGRPEGIAYSERALAIYEELGDFAGMGHTLNNLGIGFYYAGRWDEAVASYRRGREALERAGDVVGEATLANNEGEVLSDQGRLEEAEAPFRHFARVSGAAGYALGEGAAHNNLARLDARRGSFDDAHGFFASAVEIFERIGSAAMLLEARAREAECLVFQGRHAEALALLDSLEPGGGTEMTAILLERMRGFALCQARRPDEGRRHLEQSLALARDVGSDYEAALSCRALADTGGSGGEDADQTFARLGIVNLPHVPLP
jgi:class 3 adenylate cyclase/tetratricopeptide (TPR) repeat protein